MHKTSTDSNGKQTWVRRLAVGRLCLEVIPSAHALCRHMLQRIHLQFTDMRFLKDRLCSKAVRVLHTGSRQVIDKTPGQHVTRRFSGRQNDTKWLRSTGELIDPPGSCPADRCKKACR